jgi:FkbM family methyltransferase
VAQLLERSVARNGFEHVVLQRQAVSGHVGRAQLAVGSHSELNTLNLADAGATTLTETVSLTTLDASMAGHGWHDIDLLKIDAEGEEDRILAGGQRFFAELSPLVLYEIRAGADLRLDLVQSFAALGYQSYQLVLAPFDAAARLDDFRLNLFACKPDRAGRLAAQGCLVPAPDSAVPAPPEPDEWRRALMDLPYAKRLAPLWEATVARGQSAEVVAALALHARGHDGGLAPAARLAALQRCLSLLQAANRRPHNHLRLASLARVAAELGERTLAYGALAQLCDQLPSRRDIDPGEPFLAPGARFDRLAPGDAVGNWVLAAALEERERLGSHSSFFTGEASREALQTIQALGFASDEMQRRLRLVQRRSTAAGNAPGRRP